MVSRLVASLHILAFTSNQKASSNANDNIKIFQLNPLVRSKIFQNSSEVCWKVQTFSINKIEHLCFLACTIFQLLTYKLRIRDWCYIWNWLTMKLWACFMIYTKYRVGIMNILESRCWGCALMFVDKQHQILSKIHSYWGVLTHHRSLWFGRNCSDIRWNRQGSW